MVLIWADRRSSPAIPRLISVEGATRPPAGSGAWGIPASPSPWFRPSGKRFSYSIKYANEPRRRRWRLWVSNMGNVCAAGSAPGRDFVLYWTLFAAEI